jgi:hypothetical protein
MRIIPERRWLFWAIAFGAIAAARIASTSPKTAVAIWALALGVTAFALCWAAEREFLKNLGLAAGTVLITILGLDLYLHTLDPPATATLEIDEPYKWRGYGVRRPAVESFRAISRDAYTGEVIYDVAYSLDQNGHRLTPGGGPGAETYLFFGDSNTYGNGRQDDETIPWQFSKALDGRFTVLNLAFSGNGPQQMLRQLETQAFDDAVTGKVRGAYFLTIGDHPARAAGLRSWSAKAPRYEIDDSGRPRYRGTFEGMPWHPKSDEVVAAGGLLRYVGFGIQRFLMPMPARIELQTEIFAESARLLKENYGVDLLILIRDRDHMDGIEASLHRRGLATIRMSTILGDLTRPELYVRYGVDNHPSAMAARRIAEWLAARERESVPSEAVPGTKPPSGVGASLPSGP